MEEAGGQSYYSRFACHPTCPGGASGVTIGIGYDLGQVSAAGFQADWGDLLDPAVMARLSKAIGIHGSTPEGGAQCKAMVAEFADILVPWDKAVTVFQQKSLPTYLNRTLATFPGLAALDGQCVGAMVSLVYNRGTSLDGDSRTEMKTIHDLIAAGTPAGVPDQFRSMKRLWPSVIGIQKRRDAEADMFQAGLDAMARTAAVA
jgi:hypothetical protein